MGYLPVQSMARASWLDQTETVPTHAPQIAVTAAYRDLTCCAVSAAVTNTSSTLSAGCMVQNDLVMNDESSGLV